MIPFKTKPKKVLTIMPDRHIGNLVVSLPALVALRDYYQDVSHYFIVDQAFKEIVEPLLDLEFVLFYPRKAISRGNPVSRGMAYLSFMYKVWRLRPDLAIDIEGGSTSATLSNISGATIRLSKFHAGRPEVYTHRAEVPIGRHKVYDYNAIAAAAGATVPETMFHFSADSAKKKKVEALLVAEGVDGKRPLVAIHPGAGRLQKLWPVSGFVQVVDWLTRRGCQVVFVGGPSEVERAEEIMAGLARPVLNFAGRLSLGELYPLLAISAVFLGNDSGPMHMAAAMGTPVVAMFSYADDEEWGPRCEQNVVLRGQAVCVPCIKKKCTDPKCINTLSAERVEKGLELLLKDMLP